MLWHIKVAPYQAIFLCVCIVYLQTLWKVMHNYYQVRQWHAEFDHRLPKSPLSLLSELGEEEEEERKKLASAELAFNRNYVRQKLDNGLVRIWRVSGVLCLLRLFCILHLPSSTSLGCAAESASIFVGCGYVRVSI